MVIDEALYAELKPDIELVSSALFDMSKLLLRSQDNFLPYAAVLKPESEVGYVAAAGENELTNQEEILPILHSGLRHMAKQKVLSAIGIAESVTITPTGGKPTRAIKVLFEHRRGLTCALYMPFEKRPLRGPFFHEIVVAPAKPEVNAW